MGLKLKWFNFAIIARKKKKKKEEKKKKRLLVKMACNSSERSIRVLIDG